MGMSRKKLKPAQILEQSIALIEDVSFGWKQDFKINKTLFLKAERAMKLEFPKWLSGIGFLLLRHTTKQSRRDIIDAGTYKLFRNLIENKQYDSAIKMVNLLRETGDDALLMLMMRAGDTFIHYIADTSFKQALFDFSFVTQHKSLLCWNFSK